MIRATQEKKFFNPMRVILAVLMFLGDPAPYVLLAGTISLRLALPGFVAALLLTARVKAASVKAELSSSTPENPMPKLGENPSDADFEKIQIFQEPFYPTSTLPVAGENAALSKAFQATFQGDESLQALEDFTVQYPSSRWVLAVELNRGLVLYGMGYFSKARDAFQKAWEAGQGDKGWGRGLADRALAELIRMDSRVGRKAEVEKLVILLEARHPMGKAARYMEDAKDALWYMEKSPGKSFFCGPFALQSILRFKNSPKADDKLFTVTQSTEKGFTLAEVWGLSKKLGMGLQMAKRTPGAKVILPSVVHWKLNHYAALVEEKDNRFHSMDPTFGNQTWLTEKALDEESTGYFLVPKGPLPEGWQSVPQEEAATVRGTGQVNGNIPQQPCDSSTTDGDSCSSPSCGMPTANMDLNLIATMITDTPLSYNPPIGPPVQCTLRYNSESSQTTGFPGFGPNWNFQYQGYLQYDYNAGVSTAILYTPGGGQEAANVGKNTQFTLSQVSAQGTTTIFVFIPGSGVPGGVAPPTPLTVPAKFVQTRPDGSQRVYGRILAQGTLLTYLLTAMVDPQGNALHFQYDSVNHLSSIIDAIGQVTTFTTKLVFRGFVSGPGFPGGEIQTVSTSFWDRLGQYFLPEAAFAQQAVEGTAPPPPPVPVISQITDPFGRTAVFQYDNQARLVSITDQIGMVSTFTYSSVFSSDWISSMTTPYGTTTFDYTGSDSNGNHYLKMTDPMGLQEAAIFSQPQTPADINAPAPPGYGDGFLVDRNTFFWSKKAMADDPLDPASAKVYHWLHTPEGQQSGVLECIKNPLESRIWFAYNNNFSIFETSDTQQPRPTQVARLMADGSTQSYSLTCNDYGNLIAYVDPLNRQYSYNYDPANNIDLLGIVDGANESLAQYTYNSQHEPITYKDSAGETWNYTYNNLGQINSMTSPSGETTQYSYDSQGHLTSIVPPQPGAAVTYTYDNVGRVHARSEAIAGTWTYQYDNLDRVIKVEYPDGTFDQYTYNKLDLQNYRDRQGRLSSYVYDADKRLASTTDPKQQTIQYGWCSCGALTSITDPKGNKTSFDRDLEGRVVRKTYADGSSYTYEYEPTDNRLSLMTDAKKQVTHYGYDLADELTSIGYFNTGASTPSVTFQYDSLLPRLVQMSDGIGTASYNYYPIGQVGGSRIKNIFQPVGSQTTNIEFTYDANGRMASRSIDGVALSYGYSNAELTGETNSLGNFVYVYDPASARITELDYPNGQKLQMDYFASSDPLGASGRLKDLTNLGSGSTNGQVLSKFSYTYNPTGEIKTWQQQLDNNIADAKTYTMGYDVDKELQTITLTNGAKGFDGLTANQFVTYGYDAAGNRTEEQTPSFLHGFGTNSLNQLTTETDKPISVVGFTNLRAENLTVNGQGVTEDSNNIFATTIQPQSGNTTGLTVISMSANGQVATTKKHILNTFPIQFDNNGNCINDGIRSYSWDAENRLVKITVLNPQPANLPDTINMVYDGYGRRVGIAELHGAVTLTSKTFVWSGRGLCQERDTTGKMVNKQFFTMGERIGTSNYFYSFDHLTSIRQMTDTNGAVHASYDYDAYGRAIKLNGDLDADRGYGHYYVNHSTNLLMTLYRVYDSEKGRWLSRDPLEASMFNIRTGPNIYAYVGNYPVRAIDPLGLGEVDDPVERNEQQAAAQVPKSDPDFDPTDFNPPSNPPDPAPPAPEPPAPEPPAPGQPPEDPVPPGGTKQPYYPPKYKVPPPGRGGAGLGLAACWALYKCNPVKLILCLIIVGLGGFGSGPAPPGH